MLTLNLNFSVEDEETYTENRLYSEAEDILYPLVLKWKIVAYS